ncbi:hypothetical protein PHMEG_00018215 [Phytophthora megakarya]|uniref:Uncharacterized protein n=1 Tax=Phytophthora megakarya TaxID=4795 RepID=A0A225VWE6_9STRA|nr:hypothetical protein PHMEG_00018215 [Phytophthora megakarya]
MALGLRPVHLGFDNSLVPVRLRIWSTDQQLHHFPTLCGIKHFIFVCFLEFPFANPHISMQNLPVVCPPNEDNIVVANDGSITQSPTPTTQVASSSEATNKSTKLEALMKISRSGYRFMCSVFDTVLFFQAPVELPLDIPASFFVNYQGMPAYSPKGSNPQRLRPPILTYTLSNRLVVRLMCTGLKQTHEGFRSVAAGFSKRLKLTDVCAPNRYPSSHGDLTPH